MKQYHKLLADVLEKGKVKGDRTGTGTVSYFGTQTRYDLREGFPAVTTKKLAFKSVASELLWFLEGSTDERRLAEIHYGKPREELIGKTTIWTANADAQGKALGYINTDTVKELGPVYGRQWRNWINYTGVVSDDGFIDHYHLDQIDDLIEGIKNNPEGRRHIISAWNVGEIEDMALPPCHCLVQFNVTDGALDCQLYQRSADLFLGVPFNIASYALLTHMIAQVCGLEVGEFIHTTGDTHIYTNHIDQVEEQLSREPFALPKIWLNPEIKNIDDFKMEDIRLENYEHHPAIKADMAV